MTREIPANVSAYRCGDYEGKFKYFYYVLNSFKTRKDEILANEIAKEKDVLRKLATLYYYTKFCAELQRCRKIVNELKIDRNDEVLLYSYWFVETAQIAICIKKELESKCGKIRAVSRAHGYDLYEERNRLGFIPFRKFCLAEIDAVFCCSQNGQEYLKEMYPKYSDKIKVSYLGTRDHGTSDVVDRENHIIVTCSSLIPLKRVGIVAESICLLVEKGITNIKWICIGTGEEETSIKKRIAEGKAEQYVEFKGRMSNLEVLDFYCRNSISLFLNTSDKEGLPVAIMEAISFGIPAFATDVGGTKEIVKDGITGKLLGKDISPKHLSEEIEWFINLDTNERESMRKTARAFWRENFVAENNYRNFLREIELL